MSVPQAEIEYQKSHWNQDRAPPMVIGTIVSLALAAISVLIRLFVHKAVRKHLGWDDFLIVPALVLTAVMSGMLILGTEVGLGRHQLRVNAEDPHPPSHNTISLKCGYILTVVQPLCALLIRLSLLLYYRRVFTTLRKTFTWGFWTNTAFSSLVAIITLFLMIFQCSPVEMFWLRGYILSDLKPPSDFPSHGNCFDDGKLVFGTALVNLFADVGILLLPMIGLKGLQMKFRRKLGLASVFGLGSFVCAVEGIRAGTSLNIINAGDSSYSNAPAWIWAILETNLGTLCACIPSFAHLATAVLRHQRSRSAYQSHNQGQYSNNKLSTKWLRNRPPDAQSLNSLTGSLNDLAIGIGIGGRTSTLSRFEDSNQYELQITSGPEPDRHVDSDGISSTGIRMQRDVWVGQT